MTKHHPWVAKGTISLLAVGLASLAVMPHFLAASATRAAGRQAASASQGKTVMMVNMRPSDPIEVEAVLQSRKYVAPGKPSQDDLKWLIIPGKVLRAPLGQGRVAYKFQAGTDWLKNLSLVVRNRTSKSIALFTIYESFPETKATGSLVFNNAKFGALPANVAFTYDGRPLPRSGQKPLNLAPGKQRIFPLGDKLTRAIDIINARQPFSSISLLQVHFGVTFTDGMQWFGAYAKPDPNHPGRYLPMPFNFFPGFPAGESTLSQATASGQKTLLVGRLGPLDAVEVAVVLYDGRYIAPTSPAESEMNLLIANGSAHAGSPSPVAYKFQAGDDWLKNLSIVVKNRTVGHIARIWIKECFPETSATGEVTCRELDFGALPARVAYTPDGKPLPPSRKKFLDLARVEERELPLGGNLEGTIKLINARQPFSEISLCQIHVGANFVTGSRWWNGRYERPLKEEPGRYAPLPADFFPGFMPGSSRW